MCRASVDVFVRVLSAILAASLVSACAVDPVNAVTVLDERFHVVKVLSPIEIVEFNKHWQERKEAQDHLKQDEGQHFKLDLDTGKTGARWLYDSTGFVSLLSPLSQPLYKILSTDDFNRLLGVKPKPKPKSKSGVVEDFGETGSDQ